VLLLFPSRGELAAAREKEEQDGQGKFSGNVWWIKQTVGIRLPGLDLEVIMSADMLQISNACGSIGLLHTLLNLPDDGPHALNTDSPLRKFKAQSLPLSRKFTVCSTDVANMLLTIQHWTEQSCWTRRISSKRPILLRLKVDNLRYPLTWTSTRTLSPSSRRQMIRGKLSSMIVDCCPLTCQGETSGRDGRWTRSPI
jgi:hypothetical protein